MVDYAYVYRRAPASSTAADILDAIRECIVTTSGPHYWTEVSYSPGDSLELAPTAQVFGDADDQRIGFRVQGATPLLEVAYVASGTLLAPTSWSGWRSITGAATGVGASIVRVDVAEYRDDNGGLTAGPNPASSLAVMLSSSVAFVYGALAGRIVALDNESDELNGLRGDALLVGQPKETTAAGDWLTTTRTVHSSVLRTGQTTWSYLAATDLLAGTTRTDDIAGSIRLVPYAVYGLGRALPTIDLATNAGVMGQLKYFRRSKFSIGLTGAWQPRSDPNQSWQPLVYDATARPTALLWAKTITEVP
jgi:hypothetical protein